MGLNIQKYLQSGKTVKDLEEEFGVYAYEHPDLPLVGFKYGLITSESQKFHPIVREARGVVLERDSWNVVAYPFQRFFNLGEDRETESLFDWSNFSCQEKLDGSLIILYHYAGKWRVNTSGSFGQGICCDSGRSWEELFWETSGLDKDKLNIYVTYIFELWTKHNKIVRSYEPSVWLLGMKCQGPANHGWDEVFQSEVDDEAVLLGVKRPATYSMRSIDEITNFLLQTESADPTFEGFVLCDKNFNRIKVKSNSYKQLHILKGNGQFLYRNIIPQLLKGNFSKLAKDFPEWLEELEQCSQDIDKLYRDLCYVWYCSRHIVDRKEFAQYIIPRTPLYSLLFTCRDKYGRLHTQEELFKEFMSSEDYLIKHFEGKK